MKNLPIGVQTFSDFQKFNFVYVDKTELVYKMAMTGKYYFLSRPRRFGKSLLVSTFKELFKGEKNLLKDFGWKKWNWKQKYPVIHFSFDAMDIKNVGLDNAISIELGRIATQYEVVLNAESYALKFKELIEKLNTNGDGVVVLIDEYDKPIIDNLEYVENGDYSQAKANQAIMRSFYSILKNTSEHIRFLFITGISKFSKVSVFTDLNHLNDITLTPQYAALTGYTQKELEFYFKDYIDAAAQNLNLAKEDLLERMRVWYNGFSWDGVTRVYNPFGTLRFLQQSQFHNFWFSTGTPTFLLFMMKKLAVFDVENSYTNSMLLDKYDIEHLELVPLLFQTGYLTIKSSDPLTGDMILDYPNKEVRESMYQFMINRLSYAEKSNYYANDSLRDLLAAFNTGNLDKVKTTINTLLSGLPSEAYEEKSEGLYHGLLHFIFKLLGIYIKSEVHSSKGRADSVVETATHVYIFEFKFNRSAKEAMTQIKEKKYADSYRASHKTILGIGVNFVTKDRAINGWDVETL